MKIHRGRTYLFIEDVEKIVDEIDGIKYFRYPIKGVYKIPVDIVPSNEVDLYHNSMELNRPLYSFLRKENS